MFKFLHRRALKRRIELLTDYGSRLDAAIKSAERLHKSLEAHGKDELAAKVQILSVVLATRAAVAQIQRIDLRCQLELLNSFDVVVNHPSIIPEADLDALDLQVQVRYQEIMKEMP